jgi:gluconate 2-dehydrogenase gamma chain
MPRAARRSKSMTRRTFVYRFAFLGSGMVILGPACKEEPKPAPPQAAKQPEVSPRSLSTSHKTFTNAEYEALEAASERILPRDEDPGALDADVPAYIDRALQTPELHRMKDDFLNGLRALMRRSRSLYKKEFVAISTEQQDNLIRVFRDSPPPSGEAHFYSSLVVLTLEGFLCDPSYGGNKDHVGWNLVGFNTSEPPVGYDGMKAMHRHDRGER